MQRSVQVYIVSKKKVHETLNGTSLQSGTTKAKLKRVISTLKQLVSALKGHLNKKPNRNFMLIMLTNKRKKR
jgi:hypothetical protein